MVGDSKPNNPATPLCYASPTHLPVSLVLRHFRTSRNYFVYIGSIRIMSVIPPHNPFLPICHIGLTLVHTLVAPFLSSFIASLLGVRFPVVHSHGYWYRFWLGRTSHIFTLRFINPLEYTMYCMC